MCSMVKNKNPEMLEINRKLTVLYHFGFHNKKSYFPASMLGFVDNFEQHFESCVLNTQNPLKRTLNKVNGLNTSKN